MRNLHAGYHYNCDVLEQNILRLALAVFESWYVQGVIGAPPACCIVTLHSVVLRCCCTVQMILFISGYIKHKHYSE